MRRRRHNEIEKWLDEKMKAGSRRQRSRRQQKKTPRTHNGGKGIRSVMRSQTLCVFFFKEEAS